MTFGVQDGIWLVATFCVLLNLAVTLLVTNVVTKKAYKRGYQSAQTANEALALGRLMETSRERYYAGNALAQALEDSVDARNLKSRDQADPGE